MWDTIFFPTNSFEQLRINEIQTKMSIESLLKIYDFKE